MFSAEEYLFGWFFYLSAVIGLLIVFWRITQDMITWFYVRQLLRLSVATLLLTPYLVNESSSYLAPAWTVAGLDILFSEAGAFWRAGGPLLVIWCAIVLLHCLLTIAHKILEVLSSNNTSNKMPTR